MSKLSTLTPIAAVLAVSLAGAAQAAESPFALKPAAGVVLADAPAGEGKCGGDKAGAAKAAAEGKCGEGKCGGDKGAAAKGDKEGKCGGMKPADAATPAAPQK